jgi:hypothetical protein
MTAWAVGVMALKPVGGECELSSKVVSPSGRPVPLSYEFSGGGYVFCCIGEPRTAWFVRASSSSCKASWLNPCSKCNWSSSSFISTASPFVLGDFRNRDPSSKSLLSRFRLLLFDGGWRLLRGIVERVVTHWSRGRRIVCKQANDRRAEISISGKLSTCLHIAISSRSHK